MSSGQKFVADSLYAVGFLSVLASIVEGVAVSLTHPVFGSFWDSRLGFFTLLDIASFALFAFSFSSEASPWLYLTAYGAIVLSAPGAFYMFDMFMWMEFSAADGIVFPMLSLSLLIINSSVYIHSSRSSS